MQSKIWQAIKQHNESERRIAAKKSEVISSIRREALFKLRLKESMKEVNKLLQDPSIEFVVIDILKENISDFNKAVYSDEMKFYTVAPVDSLDGKNLFRIGKKEVIF